MPKRAQSLRIELLVTLALLVGLAVMSLSLVSQALAKHRHDQREVERLDIYARTVSSLVGNHFHGPEEYDRAIISDLLQQSVSTQLGIRSINLFLVGAHGATHIVSAGAEGPTKPPQSRQHGLDAEASTLGQRLVFNAHVPTFGGSPQARRPVLRITAAPERWVQSAVILQMLGLSLSIIFLMLVAGNFLLDGNILRPMRQLREATRRVAHGDLQSPIPEDGPSEFQNLAHDFNAMITSLDTERQANARQAEALRRSEQLAAVGRLAAGVAHEVGNPLAAVHGYVEFLLDPREGVARQHREILQTMSEQTERIQDIVAQLLDYSRPRAFEPEPCNVREEVLKTVELVSMDRRAAGIEFAVESGSDVCIEVDVGVFQQVVMNLLINAALASRESVASPRPVRVRIDPAADKVQILITDHGPGVPEELRDRIFEPFYTTRPVGQGSGLGLAVSRGLAERLHGDLRCVAPDPEAGGGSGACFKLVLPRAQRASGETPASA